jgi:hypothetical protein
MKTLKKKTAKAQEWAEATYNNNNNNNNINNKTKLNYLLFICQVNSYKANCRQRSVDTGNYITDQ